MKTINTLFATALIAGTAHASDIYSYSSTFNLDELSIDKVVLEVPVGELDISRGSNSEMSIQVEISGDDCRGDSEPEPTVIAKSRGERLSIEIDGDDCTAELDIVLPETTRLDIEMGVGAIDVEVTSTTRVEVGVGEVVLKVESASFEQISGEVGVGEIDLRVDADGSSDSERFFITESLTWHGPGEESLNVDLGVGEIDIRERK